MEEFAGKDILPTTVARRFSMTDPIAPFLARQRAVILDGGLATELEYRGADLDDPLWSARLLLEAPETVRGVHRAYLRAGADCVVSASYQATFEGFARRGVDAEGTESLLRLAVELAVSARDEIWRELDAAGARLRPLVAASVGPYGAYLADGSEYRGDYGLSVAELESFHRRRLRVLQASAADLLAVETIPSHREALAIARLLASEAPNGGAAMPAWISFSCRDGQSLWDGTPLRRVIAAIEANPRILALGVNCTAPEYVAELLREAASATDKPLVAYPNSGEGYRPADKTWAPVSRRIDWGRDCLAWHRSGARLIGGCCRSCPDAIRALRAALLG